MSFFVYPETMKEALIKVLLNIKNILYIYYILYILSTNFSYNLKCSWLLEQRILGNLIDSNTGG